ncbi:Uncharacterised protein [Vibrio cholerae]|nr:Uncharacterised protein [Vibrio cholerae]
MLAARRTRPMNSCRPWFPWWPSSRCRGQSLIRLNRGIATAFQSQV